MEEMIPNLDPIISIPKVKAVPDWVRSGNCVCCRLHSSIGVPPARQHAVQPARHSRTKLS